jgi:hypothetical protein
MAQLDTEIAAYDAKRQELEASHMGKWVVIHDRELIGIYDSFETAAENAVQKFGRGPYLIRQVGAPPVTLPASVMYNVVDGQNKVRI